MSPGCITLALAEGERKREKKEKEGREAALFLLPTLQCSRAHRGMLFKTFKT